jgi:hypothetical protein
MRLMWAIMALVILVAACGDAESGEQGIDTTTPDFCRAAVGLIGGQGSVSVLEFSPQFFATIDAQFDELFAGAPSAVVADLKILSDGFGLTGEIFVEFGSDNTSVEFLDALGERLDSESMVAANESISAHLETNCSTDDLRAGRSPGGYSFDRSDPVAGIANITAMSPETDPSTIQCVYDAWGDVSNIPPVELTPELWTFEICGTSLFELLTGDPRLTGVAPED